MAEESPFDIFTICAIVGVTLLALLVVYILCIKKRNKRQKEFVNQAIGDPYLANVTANGKRICPETLALRTFDETMKKSKSKSGSKKGLGFTKPTFLQANPLQINTNILTTTADDNYDSKPPSTDRLRLEDSGVKERSRVSSNRPMEFPEFSIDTPTQDEASMRNGNAINIEFRTKSDLGLNEPKLLP
mgnify:CR=1 FL=1